MTNSVIILTKLHLQHLGTHWYSAEYSHVKTGKKDNRNRHHRFVWTNGYILVRVYKCRCFHLYFQTFKISSKKTPCDQWSRHLYSYPPNSFFKWVMSTPAFLSFKACSNSLQWKICNCCMLYEISSEWLKLKSWEFCHTLQNTHYLILHVCLCKTSQGMPFCCLSLESQHVDHIPPWLKICWVETKLQASTDGTFCTQVQNSKHLCDKHEKIIFRVNL